VSRAARDPEGLQLRRAGVLIERAELLLADGPQPTAVVAQRVLGLGGNAGAAARAVFELLAGDDRFTVDAHGAWSLTPPATHPPGGIAGSLREEDWVVVDVETTGGTPDAGHRITEVAAVVVRGGRVHDVYSSLVNPQRRIPSMITRITGITDRMVSDAPRFSEIAPELERRLRGRVFVAHNAAFDWRFVSAELERCWGVLPAGRQLCTVRLARKLLPELVSRNLDALALYFGLEIESRHRAADDAIATAHVLLRFIEMLDERDVRAWADLDSLLRGRAPRRSRRPPRTPRSMDSA
jgi:DNA polymerase III subunit epsilon